MSGDNAFQAKSELKSCDLVQIDLSHPLNFYRDAEQILPSTVSLVNVDDPGYKLLTKRKLLFAVKSCDYKLIKRSQ